MKRKRILTFFKYSCFMTKINTQYAIEAICVFFQGVCVHESKRTCKNNKYNQATDSMKAF